MPKNQPQRRGPSQEERRRKAVNRPIGGGISPRPNDNNRYSRESYDNRGIRRASQIVAIIMLVAILLSVIPACFFQVPAAGAMNPSFLTQTASGQPLSYTLSRNLEREAAEFVPTASLPRPEKTLSDKQLYFGSTGHYIGGSFLEFWRSQGGLVALGYPLSEEFVQSGRTVQLFERALLELHPEEEDARNRVQAGFLGRLLADALGLRFNRAADITSSATRAYFTETGQAIAGAFKTYWEKNNGLATLGLPISGELAEGSRTRQYFERGLLQTIARSNQIETGNAGEELLEAKGWPRPTRLDPELNIGENEIYQGRMLAIRLEPEFSWEPRELKAIIGDEDLRLVKVGAAYRAFKAFAPWVDLKEYPLKLVFQDPAARSREVTRSISVVKYDYGVQNLYLPGDKVYLTSKAADDYDNAQLAAAYNTFTPQFLWKGRWNLPVFGETTTEYAQRRTYGDGVDYDIYHGGIDIAQSLGTPVATPADGKVIYTGTLQARGKAVALDHGAGVTSYYYHLNTILVKPGDRLKKGQTLGQVGTTGRSNGTHLHWEVRVNGVITYPQLFINQDVSY